MKRLLTFPNILTFLRLASSVPIYFLITEGLWRIAATFFILSCLTDFIDGAIARKNNQATDFGARLDHASDAVLATATIAALGTQGVLPGLLGVMVPIAFLQYFLDSGDPGSAKMVPSRLGKWNGIGYLLICGISLIWLAADQRILDELTLLFFGFFLCVTTALSMAERLYLFFTRE